MSTHRGPSLVRTPASHESANPHVTRRRRIISQANMSHRTVFHVSNFILDRDDPDDMGPSTSALDNHGQPTNITPISSPPTVAQDSHVETPAPLAKRRLSAPIAKRTRSKNGK